MSHLVFVDSETTGLDPEREQLFELAIIRTDGFEQIWRIEPDPFVVKRMHPKAVEVNRFHERIQEPGWVWEDNITVALQEIHDALDGAHIVGAVPDFDTRFITAMFHRFGEDPPRWHYHLIDVESMAVGWWAAKTGTIPDLPWDSEFLSAFIGVTPSTGDERHTALGDARWVKRMWDRMVAF